MHALRTLLEGFIGVLVPLMAFEIGVTTSVRDLRRELRNPALWRGLLAALLIVPALAVAVAKTLPLSPLGRGVLVLMSVSPGGPLMMSRVRRSGGNVALACALAAGLAVASVGAVPAELLALNALFPVVLHVSPLQLTGILLPELWIPLGLGLTMLAVRPAAAAKLQPALRVIVRVAMLLVTIAALIVGGRWLREVKISAWVAMIVVTPITALLGHVLGGPDPRDRRTVAYAVVLGNPAIALLVARTSYPGLELVAPILVYVILRRLATVPYDLVLSRGPRDVTRAPPVGLGGGPRSPTTAR